MYLVPSLSYRELFIESHLFQLTHLHLSPCSNFAEIFGKRPQTIIVYNLRDSWFNYFDTIPGVTDDTQTHDDGMFRTNIVSCIKILRCLTY